MNKFDDENNPLTDNIDIATPIIDVINDVQHTQGEQVAPIPTDVVATDEITNSIGQASDTETTTPQEQVAPAIDMNPSPPQANGVNMRCMRCGNFSATPFCPYCGQNILQAYQQQPQMPPPPYGGYNPRQPQQPVPQQYQQHNQQFMPYGNPQYPQYRPKQKTPVASVVALILSLVMFVMLIAMLLMSYQSTPNSYSGRDDQIGFGGSQSEQYKDNDSSKNNSKKIPNGVSADEFALIKAGMSYAQISAIIGGDGIIADSGTNIHNENYYMYGWGGEDNNSAVLYITFVDGKATDIELEGDL